MKAATDRRRRWAWFCVLWCGGLAGALGLAYAVRWVVGALA